MKLPSGTERRFFLFGRRPRLAPGIPATPRLAIECWLCALFLLAAISTFGQAYLGTLRGTITDPSGAVVPNASVVLREPATGVLVRQSPSDGQGNYEFPDIKPGTYRVTVDAAGFQSSSVDEIVLTAGQVRRIDVALKVGSVTQEAVTVTAGAALIDTESGTISAEYTIKQHDDVPLVDAYPTPATMVTTLAGIQGGGGSWGGVRANGQTMTLVADGITNVNSQEINSEFFEQVHVTTINAAADSPATSSVDMITKRGGNELHGMAYYKFFSSAFMARDFFAPKRTPYIEHEWQINVGGPIIRNRTFLFGSWFSERIPLGAFYNATVPSAALRAGVFPGTVKDPLTGQPFPGNTVPQSRMSPVSVFLQNTYYPLPNVGGATNNYQFQSPFPSDLYRYDGLLFRLDHNLTSKNSLFASWFQRTSPYVLSSALPGLFWTRFRNHQQFSVGDTHVFAPNLVNTLKFAVAWDHVVDGETQGGMTPPDGAQILAQTGLQGSNPSGLSGQGFPTMSVTGYTTMSNTAGGVSQNVHTYTVDESITKAFARHVWKSGVLFQEAVNAVSPQPNYGSFSFDGSLSGNAYADFLLGAPRSSSRTNPLPNRNSHAVTMGIYSQDTFKISKNITLEYGLRWDYAGTPLWSDNLTYNFDLATATVIVPAESLSKVSPLFPANIKVVGGDAIPNPDMRNFRPRASIAYRLTPTLVFRGGYGAFTDFATFANNASPFQISETYQNSAGQVPQFLFPNPYPSNLTLATVPGQSVVAMPRQVNSGTRHEFNVTLEKEIARVGFRGSYIGVRGTGLPYSLNINLPRPSTTPFTTSSRPYPQFVNVTQYRLDGSLHYNSLQLEAKRSMGSLTFDANYSLQSSLSNYSDLENPYDVLSHWANTPQTRRQYAVGTAIWNIPVGYGQRYFSHAAKPVELLVGNWKIYWITYLASGLYFSPSFSGSSPSNTGVNGGLPDRIGDPNNVPGGRNYKMWFNPAAFAVPPSGRFGNALPYSLTGQPLNTHHVSVAKRFRITERVSYTFTAAVSNVFNHPAFNAPLANISVAGVGSFTSTVGVFQSNERAGARQMTVKGRFEF
jgi:hypothetical protein